MASMDIQTQRFADTVVITVAGRVDHETSDRLKDELLHQAEGCSGDGDRLVIDLGGVEYISSVGLRALMMAAKKVQAQAGVMVVANPTSVVREILEISRFNMIFRIFDSVPDALAAVSAEAATAHGKA